MSKIKIVGLMKWPVANTKIKREKKIKNPSNFQVHFQISSIQYVLNIYYFIYTLHFKLYDSKVFFSHVYIMGKNAF